MQFLCSLFKSLLFYSLSVVLVRALCTVTKEGRELTKLQNEWRNFIGVQRKACLCVCGVSQQVQPHTQVIKASSSRQRIYLHMHLYTTLGAVPWTIWDTVWELWIVTPNRVVPPPADGGGGTYAYGPNGPDLTCKTIPPVPSPIPHTMSRPAPQMPHQEAACLTYKMVAPTQHDLATRL